MTCHETPQHLHLRFFAFLLCSLVLCGDTMWGTEHRDPDVTIESAGITLLSVPTVCHRFSFVGYSLHRERLSLRRACLQSRVDTTAIEVAGRRYRTISLALHEHSRCTDSL